MLWLSPTLTEAGMHRISTFYNRRAAILPKGMQECSRNADEITATFACAYQYLHPEGPLFVFAFLTWILCKIHSRAVVFPDFLLSPPCHLYEDFCRNFMQCASCCEEPVFLQVRSMQ